LPAFELGESGPSGDSTFVSAKDGRENEHPPNDWTREVDDLYTPDQVKRKDERHYGRPPDNSTAEAQYQRTPDHVTHYQRTPDHVTHYQRTPDFERAGDGEG